MATIHSLEPGIYLLVDTMSRARSYAIAVRKVLLYVNGISAAFMLDLPTMMLMHDVPDIDVVTEWTSIIQGDELTACEITAKQRLLCLYIALGYCAFLLPYPDMTPEDAHIFTDLIMKGALVLDHHDRAEEVLNEILMWMLNVLPEEIFSDESISTVEDHLAPLSTPASKFTTTLRGHPVSAAIVGSMRMSTCRTHMARQSSTAIPATRAPLPSTSNTSPNAPAALPPTTVCDTPIASALTLSDTPIAATVSSAPTLANVPVATTVFSIGSGGSLDGPAAPPALLLPLANLVATSVSPERTFSALALSLSSAEAVRGRDTAMYEDGSWASDDSMLTLVTVADSSDSDGESVVLMTHFEGQT